MRNARLYRKLVSTGLMVLVQAGFGAGAVEFVKPYSPPCTERENVFAFTEKPQCRFVGDDRYEITFTVKGYCDVTVGLIDRDGVVVRHVASGVLGANAPAPFQKNSLKQTIYWDGKDDLENYVKDPSALRVRVMLGLKPEFDKRLGGVSPYNIPGRIIGLVVAEDGAFVWSMGKYIKGFIRRFDRDGKYAASLVPPPAALAQEKLAGMGFVEYEQGKKAVHSAGVEETVTYAGNYLALTDSLELEDVRPVIVGEKLYYANWGAKGQVSILYSINTDGSTDLAGTKGRALGKFHHRAPRLATTPDNKHVYLTGLGDSPTWPAVLRFSIGDDRPAELFFGVKNEAKKWKVEFSPGADEKRLNGPCDIACDAHGRVFICDHLNNRILIASPEGKFISSFPADRPTYVCVHLKTGAIYVQHAARVQGASRTRLTKFVSAENPKPVAHVDGPHGMMALDHWSAKPRLWFANGKASFKGQTDNSSGTHSVQIWEEEGATFKRIMDFDEQAKKEDGEEVFSRWSGSGVGPKVVCDPTRQQVYVGKSSVFDLKSGKLSAKVKMPPSTDDIAFDKRGYLHAHINPGFNFPGVVRLDPAQPSTAACSFVEVPYDYGLEQTAKWGQQWKGVLPVKDQPGAKYFQDGIGVNMRGDIAEQCNIYYVPKMDEVGAEAYGWWPGGKQHQFQGWSDSKPGYAGMLRKIQEDEKKGIQTYFIKRTPGVPLAGGTIWTFDWNGELREECAVIGGNLINGVQMDEEGKLYFTVNRPRALPNPEQGAFLAGKGGTFGDLNDKAGRNPFTGTFIKSRGENVRILVTGAPIKMDAPPARPPDVFDGLGASGLGGRGAWAWVEGAEWLYAGASPIVPMQPCSCPTQRAHLDWYKRSYVPEGYRHSIGVLDTNGNLIMHLGEYGNFDGGRSSTKENPGVTMALVRFISGTDDYLCYEDNGERLVVLKLNYHAEETAPLKVK